MSLFVDTSVWYAAADVDDRSNTRAKEILSGGDRLTTTDHVLVETWTLIRWRMHREAAEAFWQGIRSGVAMLEPIGPADLQAAWTIGRDFPDQDFSMVDRTSFAAMERLAIERVASLDDDFLIFRYGSRKERAFDVLR